MSSNYLELEESETSLSGLPKDLFSKQQQKFHESLLIQVYVDAFQQSHCTRVVELVLSYLYRGLIPHVNV